MTDRQSCTWVCPTCREINGTIFPSKKDLSYRWSANKVLLTQVSITEGIGERNCKYCKTHFYILYYKNSWDLDCFVYLDSEKVAIEIKKLLEERT